MSANPVAPASLPANLEASRLLNASDSGSASLSGAPSAVHPPSSTPRPNDSRPSSRASPSAAAKAVHPLATPPTVTLTLFTAAFAGLSWGLLRTRTRLAKTLRQRDVLAQEIHRLRRHRPDHVDGRARLAVSPADHAQPHAAGLVEAALRDVAASARSTAQVTPRYGGLRVTHRSTTADAAARIGSAPSASPSSPSASSWNWAPSTATLPKTRVVGGSSVPAKVVPSKVAGHWSRMSRHEVRAGWVATTGLTPSTAGVAPRLAAAAAVAAAARRPNNLTKPEWQQDLEVLLSQYDPPKIRAYKGPGGAAAARSRKPEWQQDLEVLLSQYDQGNAKPQSLPLASTSDTSSRTVSKPEWQQDLDVLLSQAEPSSRARDAPTLPARTVTRTRKPEWQQDLEVLLSQREPSATAERRRAKLAPALESTRAESFDAENAVLLDRWASPEDAALGDGAAPRPRVMAGSRRDVPQWRQDLEVLLSQREARLAPSSDPGALARAVESTRREPLVAERAVLLPEENEATAVTATTTPSGDATAMRPRTTAKVASAPKADWEACLDVILENNPDLRPDAALRGGSSGHANQPFAAPRSSEFQASLEAILESHPELVPQDERRRRRGADDAAPATALARAEPEPEPEPRPEDVELAMAALNNLGGFDGAPADVASSSSSMSSAAWRVEVDVLEQQEREREHGFAAAEVQMQVDLAREKAVRHAQGRRSVGLAAALKSTRADPLRVEHNVHLEAASGGRGEEEPLLPVAELTPASELGLRSSSGPSREGRTVPSAWQTELDLIEAAQAADDGAFAATEIQTQLEISADKARAVRSRRATGLQAALRATRTDPLSVEHQVHLAPAAQGVEWSPLLPVAELTPPSELGLRSGGARTNVGAASRPKPPPPAWQVELEVMERQRNDDGAFAASEIEAQVELAAEKARRAKGLRGAVGLGAALASTRRDPLRAEHDVHLAAWTPKARRGEEHGEHALLPFAELTPASELGLRSIGRADRGRAAAAAADEAAAAAHARVDWAMGEDLLLAFDSLAGGVGEAAADASRKEPDERDELLPPLDGPLGLRSEIASHILLGLDAQGRDASRRGDQSAEPQGPTRERKGSGNGGDNDVGGGGVGSGGSDGKESGTASASAGAAGTAPVVCDEGEIASRVRRLFGRGDGGPSAAPGKASSDEVPVTFIRRPPSAAPAAAASPGRAPTTPSPCRSVDFDAAAAAAATPTERARAPRGEGASSRASPSSTPAWKTRHSTDDASARAGWTRLFAGAAASSSSCGHVSAWGATAAAAVPDSTSLRAQARASWRLWRRATSTTTAAATPPNVPRGVLGVRGGWMASRRQDDEGATLRAEEIRVRAPRKTTPMWPRAKP